MQTIVITSTDELWEEAQKTGLYTHSTFDSRLDAVGFIHATNPDQTMAMLNRHFTNRHDVLLLLVDVNKLKPEVKFEAPLSGSPGLYPHIYGPLNIDGVYGTLKPIHDASGNFIEPKELGRLVS